MFIKDIELKNYKKHSYSKYTFDRINLITSDKNGIGKSSILDALRILLLNYTKETLQDDIQETKTFFELTSNFSLYGIDYNEYLKVNKKNTERILKYNDIELTDSNVTKYLAGIINPTITLYSSIAIQNETTNILKEGNSDRLKKLKLIFGLTEIEEKVKKLAEDIKEIKHTIELLEKDILVLEKEKFSYYQEFTLSDLDELKERYNELIKTKEQYEAFKIYEKELNLWEEAQKQINTDIYELKPLPDFSYNTLQELNESYYKLKNEFSEYKKNNELFEKLTEDLEILNGKIETLTLFEERPIPILSFTKDQYNELVLNIKETKNHIELSKIGKCYTCGQDFLHDEKELTNKLSAFEKTLESYKTEQDVYEQVGIYNKKINNENDKTTNKLNSYTNEKDKIEKQLISLTFIDYPFVDLQNLEIKINEYKKLEQSYNKINEENKLIERKIIEQQNKLETLNKISKPKKVKFVEFDNNEFNIVANELIIYENKKQELERIRKHNETIKQQELDNKKQLEDKQQELHKLFSNQENMEKFKKKLDKEFSSNILTTKLAILEKNMQNFFQKVYPIYNVYLKQDKTNIDFFYGNQNHRKASLASGFEAELLSVAFRIALSKFKNLELMILDESDSNARPSNSLLMYQNLLAYCKNYQFFIITQKDETIEYLCNNYNVNLIEL